jgi:hypothetical protein
VAQPTASALTLLALVSLALLQATRTMPYLVMQTIAMVLGVTVQTIRSQAMTTRIMLSVAHALSSVTMRLTALGELACPSPFALPIVLSSRSEIHRSPFCHELFRYQFSFRRHLSPHKLLRCATSPPYIPHRISIARVRPFFLFRNALMFSLPWAISPPISAL